jgi:hypothetical protein
MPAINRDDAIKVPQRWPARTVVQTGTLQLETHELTQGGAVCSMMELTLNQKIPLCHGAGDQGAS